MDTIYHTIKRTFSHKHETRASSNELPVPPAAAWAVFASLRREEGTGRSWDGIRQSPQVSLDAWPAVWGWQLGQEGRGAPAGRRVRGAGEPLKGQGGSPQTLVTISAGSLRPGPGWGDTARNGVTVGRCVQETAQREGAQIKVEGKEPENLRKQTTVFFMKITEEKSLWIELLNQALL